MENPIRTIELKLRLGEVTLGSWALKLSVVSQNVFSEVQPATIDSCSKLALEAASDGTFLSSAPALKELPRTTNLNDKLIYVSAQYPRYYVDLTMGFEAYQQKFSAKSRSGIKRKVKKFAKASGGEIEWSVHSNANEIRDFHRQAVAVSSQTYQEKMFDAGLPDTDQYCEDMVAKADRGEAKGFLISMSGQPIAYLYCPIQDGVVAYSYLGFLDEYKHLSPGTVLLWLALEDLFSSGTYNIFDFTQGGIEGQHSQKGFFSTANVHCADIYILKANVKNKLKIYSAIGLNSLSESSGNLLDKIGVKKKVRGILRRLS